MKKIVLLLLALVTVIGATTFIIYRLYLPDVVAEALVADELPPYIPRRFKNKIEELRTSVNKGSEDLIRDMHRANIPLEKILQTIDETTEEEAYGLLDELNDTQIRNADQVFDIAKKYIHTDFDVEVFRKSFTSNFNVKMIRKGIQYANINRKTNELDMETAKAIVKKVILETDKDIRSTSEAATITPGKTKSGRY